MATDTRARMIETTARLLRIRGYHGAALNDILAESGTPRGSLYFHFPGGKDQLVLEATRAAVEQITENRRQVLAAAETPVAAIHTFTEAIAAVFRQTDYAFGCPIAPIVLDGTKEAAELSELCRRTFEEWVGLLEASFKDAGIPEKRAQALALLTQSSFEGAMLIARAYRDCEPISAVAAELARAVEAALPSSGKARPQSRPRKARAA